jgi:hypothetical protein
MQLTVIQGAPVHRQTVAAPSQTLGDTEAGRALAGRLADAASSFDIINGRAVQTTDMYGRAIDGKDEADADPLPTP